MQTYCHVSVEALIKGTVLSKADVNALVDKVILHIDELGVAEALKQERSFDMTYGDLPIRQPIGSPGEYVRFNIWAALKAAQRGHSLDMFTHEKPFASKGSGRIGYIPVPCLH